MRGNLEDSMFVIPFTLFCYRGHIYFVVDILRFISLMNFADVVLISIKLGARLAWVLFVLVHLLISGSKTNSTTNECSHSVDSRLESFSFTSDELFPLFEVEIGHFRE
jgi:hypothetical protein